MNVPMKTILLLIALLLSGNWFACAQGTLIYDQQSATNNNYFSGQIVINTSQPIGQSFIPSLASIGFVRFHFGESAPVSLTATVSVNLWSGGISNGVLLAATAPVFLSFTPLGSVSANDFYFAAPVALTPGTTYFLQPLVESETEGRFSSLNIALFDSLFSPATYPNGMAFINGIARPDTDLWFREGIVAVPEPSIGSFILVALILRFLFSFQSKRLAQLNTVIGTHARLASNSIGPG
jgi:hypothetical protein